MKSGISKLIAAAGATALLAGAGALTAAAASADTAATHTVAHAVKAPMGAPISAHGKHRDDPFPAPDYCLWLLGLPVLCD